MSSIIPSIRTFLHRDQVLLDTMPLFMHIAIPNLRSVSTFKFLKLQKFFIPIPEFLFLL